MINRRILNHLHKASKDKDEKELTVAYQCISSEVQDDLKKFGANTTIYPDSLVLCAEISAELNKWDIASVVLEWYFVSNPPRDQYFCRAFFVKALVAADVAKSLKYPLSVDQQLKAISYIMQGVDSIKAHLARYDFLVYNASVLYWRLARPLLRDGVRTKLLPTLKVLSKYLEDINEVDIEWRARYLIQLAKAYEDSALQDDAIKTAAMASQLLLQKMGRPVSANVVPTPLKIETFKLQVQLCKNNPDALAKLKTEAHSNPLLRASYVLQSTKSKAKDNLKLGNELKEVLSYIAPLGERLEHEITAEVGRVALLYSNFTLAKECAERIAASKFLKCRILSEFIICELLVVEYITPPPSAAPALSHRGPSTSRSTIPTPFDYDEEQLSSLRSQAVRRLASALELGLRLVGEATESESDIHVMIEDNCILIWNLGYPLLQDRTRMNVHKGFEAAASALETIASGLVELRSKFHYEVALCEMKKDTLAKAMSQVEKGIALNESTEFYQSCLAPLKRKLELKTNLYSDTNAYSEMEQAFLLVEELKEAKETTLQKTLLVRAVQHLASLPPLGLGDPLLENGNQPLTFGSIHDLPAALGINTVSPSHIPSVQQVPLGSPIDRASLWHEVIQFASKKNFHEIVLNATKQFLDITWLKTNNRDISILAAQAHFMRAQSLLAQQNPELDVAVQQLLAGMRIGVKLMESWVVFNAVILIWNAYFNVIKQSRQNEITEALQECFQALMQVNSSSPITGPRDLELVASVANALACAHEQTYLKRKKAANEPVDDKKKGKGSSAPDATNDLKLAEEVCKSSLGLAIPAAYKRALLATLTRIQRYKGITPQAGAAEKLPMRGPEGESQIVSLLEVLATEPESRKRDLLAKALDLLDQANSSNTELMTMIAVEYYTLGDHTTSLQIATHTLQQIPSEDKSTLSSVAPKQWRWFAVNETLCGQNIIGLLNGMKNDKLEKIEKPKTDRDQSPVKLQVLLNHRTIKLYKLATEHFAQGAKYGSMAGEKSLVLQAATNYWNAGLALMTTSDTRWILLATVQMVLHSLRSVQDTTWSLQIPLYKLYLRCLIDQKTWGEGLKVAEQTLKRIPKIHHESLWEERVVFKSNIKRTVEPYASALKDNNKPLLAKSYILVARTNSDKEKCNTAYQKAIAALSDSPIDSVPYRMEYAHYLYSNCFPMKDARVMLVEAIDLLTSIEAASFEIDILADEEHPDQQFQQVALRLSSKIKKTTASMKKDGKEVKFKSQTTSQQQSQQDKQQLAATKGVLTVQHQATLVAVFVMLSTVSSPAISSQPTSASVRVDLLLMAHHWVIRIWQGFFAHAAKNPPPKPGKDETLCDLPKTAVEWASVLLTEEATSRLRGAGNPFITAVRSRDGLVKGIGSEAFLTYLMYLEKHLEIHGYFLHCFAVLQLARVLIGELSPKPLVMPLLAQLHLLFHNVCQKLHMEDHARIWMDQADGAVVQAFELKGYFADELQYHELLQTVQRDANFFNPLSTKSDSNAAKVDARPMERINVRVVYHQLARQLIDCLNLRYAKQFVAEAAAHAMVYGDKVTQAWCYHLSAKIHFIEGDPQKALQLQQQALLSDIGEVEFWAESYTCLADIHLAIDPFSTSKPLTLLGNALEALNKQEEEWPNFRSDILFAQATILNKYGSLCTHQGGGSNKIAIEYEALEAAMGVLEQSLQNFKQLGCIPQIVNTLMALAKLVTDNLHALSNALVLQHSLEDGEDMEVSPSLELLSKAMELLLQADAYASSLFSATVFGEYKGEISPPIVDQLSSIKLAIGQLEWTMADLTAEQNQRRKETIEQLLDRFERQHQTIVAPEEQFSSHSHRAALSFLNSAHALVPSSPLAIFWLAIHIMSYSAKIGKPHTPWKSISFSDEPTVGNLTVRDDAESIISTRPGTPISSAMNPAQIFSMSAPLPEQAITLLMQGVEIAHKKLPSIVPSAALTLVDWLGSLSSAGSARYLAKSQSFSAKAEMLEIFNSVLPASEREKILINLESTFKKNFTYPQILQPYRSTLEYLNAQSLVWPRIECDGNYQDIVDSLPKGVSVLVFHHTSDFRVLYLSCLASDASPVVARAETDPELFAQIIRHKRNFEALARATALKVSKNDLTPPDLSNDPPPVEQQSSKALKKSATVADNSVNIPLEETDETVVAFADLLEVSELFFAPLWNAFPKAARESHVVLVIDSALSNAPLEALHVFVKAKSITREFSLQFFATRSKLAARANSQKFNFTYITDPRNEDSPTQTLPLYKSMCDLVGEDFLPSRKKEKSVQEGVLGSDHTPTPEEWQKLMSESSHFVYFGFSPMFSYLDPNYIACLNMSGCSTMILIDKATNEASHRRQTKMDIQKSSDEKRVLSAHNTCTLLSLRGVTATVINQWHTTQKINGQLLFEVHDLMSQNKLPSEALQHSRQLAIAAVFASKPNASSATLNISRGQSRMQLHEQHLQQVLLYQQQNRPSQPQDPDQPPGTPDHDKNLPPVSREYILTIAKTYHKFNAVCYGCTFPPTPNPKK